MTRRMDMVTLGWLACGLAFLAFALFARTAADAPSTSDTAVIESYTRFASEGRLAVGAYSRFQWHHPGPLYFYVIAPFYVASGERTAGLHAGAAGLSLFSFALAGTVLLRRRSPASMTVLLALALLVVRSGEALVSPWNPHVPLVPVAALVVVAADVIAGNVWMLPAVAFLASVAGQAHIALLPCVLFLGVAAFARGLLAGATGMPAREWRLAIAATLGLLVLIWAPTLYEQVTAEPRGNITELWQFFAGQSRRGQPQGVAISAWSDMLVGPLRRDFYVAHGWPFEESRVRWAEGLSLVAMATTFLLSWRSLRAGRRFDAVLGGVSLVASMVALWSVTHIEERIFDHDVFWIAGVGVVTLGTALGLALSTVVGETPLAGKVPAAAFALVMATAIGSSVRGLATVVRGSLTPPAEARIARAIADDVQAYLDREKIRRPVIRLDQDAWGVAAGAILDLQKRGYQVAVEEDWVVMFTPECRPRATDDAVLTVAAPAEHLRMTDRGVPLVSAHEPVFVHAEPRTP